MSKEKMRLLYATGLGVVGAWLALITLQFTSWATVLVCGVIGGLVGLAIGWLTRR